MQAGLYSFALAPPCRHTAPHCRQDPSAIGASAIIDILDENGLVRNKTFAKIHARIGGYDSLQANSYMRQDPSAIQAQFSAP